MTTPIYALGEWAGAQASPWVPHNAALRVLEAVGRGSVLDRDLAAPPGACADGACYLIADAATGAWTGYDGKLAVAVGANGANGWLIANVATEGQFLYIEDEALRIQFIGGDWETANLAPLWGDITGSIADQTDLTAAITAAGGNTGGSQQLTGVVSGLGVINTANLDFAMSAGSFYLDGELVTAAAQTISLDAADVTHPRIDVLYVDDTGTLGKITGTPLATPSQPSVDPTTQLFLTFVLVPATATSLGGIDNVDIYREGTEWVPTTSGAGFTVNSTSTPYAGTKCIEGTAVVAGAYVRLVAAAPIDFAGDGNLTLRIRSKATWNAKRWLTLQWYNGGVATGSQVSLKSGSFGFASSDTAAYQLVVINKSLFQVPAGASVDELRIADVGGAIGFFIDDVILQTTGETTGGGGQVSGITQADADARYARRANNLSDLTDATAARTNLDVYSKGQVDSAIAAGGGGAGGLADGDYGDVTVSGDGTAIAVKDGVLDVANFAGGAVVTSSEGIASNNNDTSLATTAAVTSYVASMVTGLLDMKADIDCAASPNYPAASKGDLYYVTVAGKIGGTLGKSVDVGDAIIAKADNAGGNEAAVGSSWFVLEHNAVDAGSSVGLKQLSIPAGAMKIRTTNGAAAGSAETTTNKHMIDSLDFDAATQEHAQFTLVLPQSWNAGTLAFAFIWTTAGTTGNVIWGAQGVCRADGDAMDAAFGTAVEVTDACQGADKSHRTATTAAMTLAGTPAKGERVALQFYRKAADAGDTLAADAKLLEVIVFFTTDAATDA